jgi:ribonuclease P protein component
MDRMLRPLERVRQGGEYRRILKSGKCFRDPLLRIHYRENGRDLPRLGLVVSRKVGNAVVRNRLKRIYRALFREMKGRLPSPIDVVVIPNPQAGPRDHKAYAEVFERFIAWTRSRGPGAPEKKA